MAYLIIFIVVVFVLTSVMALKPGKKQIMQQQLRERARQLGLQVKVGRLPQTHRQQVRREDPRLGVVYRLLWRHPEIENEHFEYLLQRRETELQPMPAAVQEPLQQCLTNLPDYVEAIEFNNQGVGVYWLERGNVVGVEDIADQLGKLQLALQDKPLKALVKL